MENEKIKTSRASAARVKQEKPKVWTPPSSLDAPPAPDGYRHRWIRAESMGQDDTKNMSGKIRSGWELVRADEYPDSTYPTMADGKYAGVIGVGGLLLARIPEELATSRADAALSFACSSRTLRLSLRNSSRRMSCSCSSRRARGRSPR